MQGDTNYRIVSVQSGPYHACRYDVYYIKKQALVTIEDEYYKLFVNSLGIMWNATTILFISMSSKYLTEYLLFVYMIVNTT